MLTVERARSRKRMKIPRAGKIGFIELEVTLHDFGHLLKEIRIDSLPLGKGDGGASWFNTVGRMQRHEHGPGKEQRRANGNFQLFQNLREASISRA